MGKRSEEVRVLLRIAGGRCVHPSGAQLAMSRPDSVRGFDRIAKLAARFTGRPLAFGWPCGGAGVAGDGPLFGFSYTWQLVINTGTTVVRS